MKHAVTRELYQYWNLLRNGRSAPERADIDPAAIRGILADTFILETDQAEPRSRVPIRLSGTRLNALFLAELKGQSFLGLWTEPDRRRMIRVIADVLGDRSPAILGLRAMPRDGIPIDLEMLLLPLRHRGQTHTRILGAVAPLTIPSWLGLRAVVHFGLQSLRMVGEVDGFDPAMSPMTPSDQSGSYASWRHGYLVVHQGGR